MFKFKNSLILRTTVPIIILLFSLWALLYYFVLTPFSELAKANIENDLASFSQRINSICNISLDNLLLSDPGNNHKALNVEKAFALSKIEKFFNQENLKGLIYDTIEQKIVLLVDLPTDPQTFIKHGYVQRKLISLEVGKDNFFVSRSSFKPWNWQVFIVKNTKAYSNLLSKTDRVYGYVIGSLVLISLLLVFFIYQSINRPVRTIIKTINQQQKPTYRGIDVFEFLSDTISDMMESIHQNNEKYRILVENSNHLVWEVDLYNRFTFVSSTVTNILGYIPDELIGTMPFALMLAEEVEYALRNYSEKVARELNIEGFINTYIHKNGNYIVLETNGIPIYDNEGNLLGYRGISRDITKRVHAEKEKTDAQSIAADQAQHALLGQVAGTMAHDFNNILGVIMGNTELALLDCEDKEIKKTLKLTLEQTLRGKSLTKNLVVFAKDQELKQEFFSFNEKTDLVVNLLKKELKGIKVIKKNGTTLPDLFADPGMVEHAFINLLQNSIHALSKTEHPKIIIRTYCNKENIFCEVVDNGCGIPKNYLKKIYEPSFTLKGAKDITGAYKTDIKGTGYGMINIKKCVDQHKGSISVKSRVDFGTKFTISMPIINKELTDKEKNEIYQSNIQIKRNILIVEDEKAISDILCRVLTQEPCRHIVDIADKGLLAMELFDKKRYDLISLDYLLSEEHDGMDVYNHIRQKNKTIPILFVSSNIEFLGSINKIKQKDKYVDHLTKPLQNKEYVKGVNELLEKIKNKN